MDYYSKQLLRSRRRRSRCVWQIIPTARVLLPAGWDDVVRARALSAVGRTLSPFAKQYMPDEARRSELRMG